MKLFKFVAAAMLVLGSASPSLAHEMRNLGGDQGNGEGANAFKFYVGFSTEPAYTGEVNGIDLYTYFYPDAAHDPALTEPVNTAAGDVVKLEEAEVLLLDSPSQSARVISRKLLPLSSFLDDKGNIRKKYGTDEEYIVYFRPTITGAYGFHLKGHVEHKGHMVDFNETFVCGAGSKDIDPTTGLTKTKFECVEDAIAFPDIKLPRRR